MKPIYLLFLLLMACGFFACKTDMTQDLAALTPLPAEKTLNAEAFAEVAHAMIDLGLFNEEDFKSAEHYGVMDVRLFIDDEESVTADFLFDEGFEGAEFLEGLLAGAPDRAWEQTITMQFDEAEADRLNTWLNHHFSGAEYLDLRIMALQNGTITVRGLRPSAAERDAHPPQPFF